MGARRDFLNQALLDQRRSVYRGTIQPNMADICCCGVRCGNVWTGG